MRGYPGIVAPAHLAVPPYVRTLGPEVAAVNELAGFSPDPEQRLGLDIIFGLDEQGRSAAFEIACICCRQNLKTGLVKMAELGWLFVTDERLIVHSAHEFATSAEAFRDLDELIAGSSFLSKRIKAVYRGSGAEAIETKTGARIVFKTRTKGGGRGLSGRKVVLDEAFALRAGHMGALLPLLSAQPDPQVIYASSACLADSEILHEVVARGRSAAKARRLGQLTKEARLAFLEWCMDDPETACRDGKACTHGKDAIGCGLDDPRQRQKANPALGRRIRPETIDAERRALPPEEFARERGGLHDAPASGLSIITKEEWARTRDPLSVVEDPVALAFDVRPDGLAAAIAAVGRRADGRLHGEILEYRAGPPDWAPGRLAQIVKRAKTPPVAVALDPSSPAGALLEQLRGEGFEVCGRDDRPPVDKTRIFLVSGREYAQACGAFVGDVRGGEEGPWRHFDQAPLNEAVEGARTRASGDAWVWARKDSSVDISPLVAVTEARHAFVLFGEEAELEPWVYVG